MYANFHLYKLLKFKAITFFVTRILLDKLVYLFQVIYTI